MPTQQYYSTIYMLRKCTVTCSRNILEVHHKSWGIWRMHEQSIQIGQNTACKWDTCISKSSSKPYLADTLLPHQRSDWSYLCHFVSHTQSGCTLNQNTAQSLNVLDHYLHQNRHQYEL